MRCAPVLLAGWLAAGLLGCAALAGCAAISDPVLTPSVAARTSVPVRPAPEIPASARGEHERILAAYGCAYEEPRLQAMLERNVARLVAASDRPDMPYRITVLNSPAINAFALSTSQLYVTRGLLALASDEAELASVLAHEMAHVTAQHAASRADRIRRVALINAVTNDLVADPAVGALAQAKSKLALASFSRQQEFEADRIGIATAARAGFDPRGAIRFLTAMERNATARNAGRRADSRPLDFLASHPATPERIAGAQAAVRRAGSESGEAGRDEYLAAIDGLPYGEDRDVGLVRGRRFLHPRLGFTFTAPEGFTLENTSGAVLGSIDRGGEALRFDSVTLPAGQSLADYLTSGWLDGVDPRSIESLTLPGGLPAAAATATNDAWSFQIVVARLGEDVYRFVFAAKSRNADTDRSFRQAAASFRRMTPTEIAAAKPLRLAIVTVGAGDTIDGLAGRMAGGETALERLLVLNGLSREAALRPGTKVKLVTE